MVPVQRVQQRCSYRVIILIFLKKSLPSCFRSGQPQYSFSRPPFYPSHFMPPHPFMMHPGFPMANLPPHGTISPTQQLTINGNEPNSVEIVNSTNLTPNSLSYDGQTNDGIHSPASNGESHSIISISSDRSSFPEEKPTKSKKVKKSTKKKTRTSAMIEDV